MVGSYKIRTDLALENREKFERDHVEVEGVILKREYDQEQDIRTTRVEIKTEHGAKVMEKPCGTYITVEAPDMALPDKNFHGQIANLLGRHLKSMLPEDRKNLSVLVAGLGNREVTPDALGPQVIQQLKITRHMVKEYGNSGLEEGPSCMVSSIAPGVMAQTGMETLEVLRGIVRETKPTVIIAVDALAARSTRRLNCTIQLTDTGIHPGSGVFNFRSGLSQETLGVPVIGIGVPTVVDAASIVHDAVSQLLEALEEAEIEEFLGELITPGLQRMFVTPKDVDETLQILSKTIAQGINLALQEA